MRILFAFLFVFVSLFGFEKSVLNGDIIQDGKGREYCPVCGMNLKKFYKTNHAVVLKSGEKLQFCSMHCLIDDYDKIKNSIKNILVIDVESDKFIDAKKAFYLVGSKVEPTMSSISEIAFSKEESAKNFAKEFGGKVMSFDEAFEDGKKRFEKDSQMIEGRKEMKIYPMGEKLYKQHCKPIDKSKYDTISSLKADVVKLCGVDEMKAHAISHYVWTKNIETINVPLDAKCPVCGMFVSKYPKWSAKIGEYYFDGVKDMMKFYFEPSKYTKHKHNLDEIYVTDYYTLKKIDGKKAFYVVGSDILGPMGNELIPFENLNKAKEFLSDHRGKNIIKFEDITQKIIKELR